MRLRLWRGGVRAPASGIRCFSPSPHNAYRRPHVNASITCTDIFFSFTNSIRISRFLGSPANFHDSSPRAADKSTVSRKLSCRHEAQAVEGCTRTRGVQAAPPPPAPPERGGRARRVKRDKPCVSGHAASVQRSVGRLQGVYRESARGRPRCATHLTTRQYSTTRRAAHERPRPIRRPSPDVETEPSAHHHGALRTLDERRPRQRSHPTSQPTAHRDQQQQQHHHHHIPLTTTHTHDKPFP